MKIGLALLVASATATVYFQEKFGDDWESRWVKSEWKDSAEIGEWKHTAGKYYADENDKGIQTSQDARFYGISAKMDKVFDNKGKQLVVQYTVKHDQDLDCGGAVAIDRAGRRAQLDALAEQPGRVRGAHLLVVPLDVAPAQIVRHEEDQVRLGRGRLGRGEAVGGCHDGGGSEYQPGRKPPLGVHAKVSVPRQSRGRVGRDHSRAGEVRHRCRRSPTPCRG